MLVSCGGGGGGGSGDDDVTPVAESGSAGNGSGASVNGSSGGAGSGTSSLESGSGNTSGGSTSGSGSSTTTDGFVLVSGGMVTGGDKFTLSGYTDSIYQGAFVAGRTVTVSPFYICEHEVTQAEYESVMGSGSNPSSFNSNPASGETQANRPVENVSWYDALVYCNKRSMAEGLTPCYTINGSTNPPAWGNVPTSSDSTWNAVICNFNANGYRLPTEVEWEYAARGGASGCSAANPNDYAGTDDRASLGSYAWYLNNAWLVGESSPNYGTHEVKKKNPNGLNLYDMSGNVSEWCWDWFGSIDASTPSAGSSSGSSRVGRGGAWGREDDLCSVARRIGISPHIRNVYIGFRVVRTAD
ncbi:MAG: SUMF1/EgtB/PvdO family nonheme iron enzyme [Treponema sp.]|nr:SUMF1/EgtB/PvdO family nonheme iron enzyme [Treponema sp.]